jgi:hypothetical protein
MSKHISLFYVFFGVFVSAAPGITATEKPFYLLRPYQVSSLDGNREAQSCLLQKHLPEHLQFVINKIIPRGLGELPEMLKPHQIDGKKFYIAYNTDYPDLYHFHLRYPTQFSSSDFSKFLDSSNYHLQFHSTEHFDLMKIQWLYALAALGDISTKVWAEPRIAKAISPSTSSYTRTSTRDPSENFPLFDDEDVLRVSLLWHRRLAEKSPGLEFLVLRVAILNDPIHHTSEVAEILNWRSVASHDDRFEILPTLDLNDVWQPVDFFFAKISENLELASEIRAFTSRTGQKWINNFDGDHGKFFSPSAELRKDSQETMLRIYRWIAQSPDDLNTLKHTVLDNTRYTDAITLHGDYVVAIHYHISRTECAE